MGYSVGFAVFVVGALCMLVAGALVLDTLATNERRGLPWHVGVGEWAVIGLLGFGGEVLGFVLALGMA